LAGQVVAGGKDSVRAWDRARVAGRSGRAVFLAGRWRFPATDFITDFLLRDPGCSTASLAEETGCANSESQIAI
jgi:hypothetical protein